MRAFVASLGGLLIVVGSITASAQSWQPPTDNQRCPSKWGADDQRGSANQMTPEAVLRASQLIRTGQVFELGRVLSPTMPMFGTRRFESTDQADGHEP